MLSTSAAIPIGLVPEPVLRQARDRHVYQQQMLKEALLAAMPRAMAFAAYCEAIDLPGPALQDKALMGLLHAAEAFGRSVQVLEPAGRRFLVAPPTVFGEGNHQPLHGRQRTRFLACFENAQVRSRSSAVELETVLALDFEAEEALALDDRLNLDPSLFDVEGARAYAIGSTEPVLQIEQAFSLLGTHSWAFGHWMWEFLPRYLAAQIAGLAEMPVLVDAGMPAQHYQSLRSILPAGATILELPARSRACVQRLWVAPTPMHMPQYERMNDRFRWDPLAADPRSFADLLREWNQRVAATPGSARKLFFARRQHRHRKLLNHAEVEALAVERGYQVVFPEDIDFDAQVAMVRGAEQIIGPEGSAMFLAFLARPGTRVGILNHPYTAGLPVLTGLLEAAGLRVEVLTGPAASSNEDLPHFIDYRVDPGRFAAFLDGTLRA